MENQPGMAENDLDYCVCVQVVSFDYYMLRNHRSHEFIQPSEDKLPVIRIFGSTDSGQRCVVHIHGCLPYLYFRPANVHDLSFDDFHNVESYLLSFHRKLEDEMQKKKNVSNTNAIKRRCIHRLQAVSKRLLYGYWPDPKPFVKVFLKDPNDVKALVTILEVWPVYLTDNTGQSSVRSNFVYVERISWDCNAAV